MHGATYYAGTYYAGFEGIHSVHPEEPIIVTESITLEIVDNTTMLEIVEESAVIEL